MTPLMSNHMLEPKVGGWAFYKGDWWYILSVENERAMMSKGAMTTLASVDELEMVTPIWSLE